ncbi:hypothetical protein LEMLEM_LOCUS15840, partial [Lemmus lemmus]
TPPWFLLYFLPPASCLSSCRGSPSCWTLTCKMDFPLTCGLDLRLPHGKVKYLFMHLHGEICSQLHTIL